MNGNNQTKREWASQVLEQLTFLSDINVQKKSWLEGGGPVSPGFDEEICVLYDSYSFEDDFLKDAVGMGLSDSLVRKLNNVNLDLNKFITRASEEGLNEKDIISNKEWLKIVNDLEGIVLIFNLELVNISHEYVVS